MLIWSTLENTCLVFLLLWSKWCSFILIYSILDPYIVCCLLTPLTYWINRNSEKDKFDKNSIHCLTSRFGMNEIIFVFTPFPYIHTSVKFCALNICVICLFCNKIRMTIWLGFIILWSPKKGSRENFDSIFDFPEIPNQSKFLSDCLSIGVALKFTFHKGRKFNNNPVPSMSINP